MTDLGNLAEEPTRSMRMECAPCDVEWRGCAAVSHCPRCGQAVCMLCGVDFDGCYCAYDAELIAK